MNIAEWRAIDAERYPNLTISLLLRYVHHDATCNLMVKFKEPCTCGLDALLYGKAQT